MLGLKSTYNKHQSQSVTILAPFRATGERSTQLRSRALLTLTSRHFDFAFDISICGRKGAHYFFPGACKQSYGQEQVPAVSRDG